MTPTRTRQRTRPRRLSLPVLVVAGLLAWLTPAVTATAAAGDEPVTLEQQADHVEVAVHRGLRVPFRGRVADEDTPRACVAAVISGADACEIDVRITGNGVPVVLHDPNTGRVTRGGRKCNLRVATHTYGRLARCRLNHGDPIARLADLARAMQPYGVSKSLIVELKGRVFSTVELARVNWRLGQYGFTGARQNLVYESYFRENLRGLEQIAPSVPSYLISHGAPTAASVAEVGGLEGLILPYERLVGALAADPSYVDELAAAGLRVMPWLVNTPDAMRYVVAAGADGFMTDNATTLSATMALRRGP